MRRELLLVFRSVSTWIVLAIGALVCGHGALVAIDVFSSASRSAHAGTFMMREMDPLAGIVRPSLGALELATSLLVPILAVRAVAVEKERGTFRASCLAAGSHARVIARKLGATSLATILFVLVAALDLVLYVALGGSLDLVESLTAVTGHLLQALFVCALSIAAASLTRTNAQAITVALLASIASWAIESASSLAALAWIGGASTFSIGAHLASFDRGIFALADVAWFAIGIVTFAAVACMRSPWLIVPGLVLMSLSSGLAVRRDWSEQKRSSYPPSIEAGLRTLGPIHMRVWLDRDDARRAQLEDDMLMKLRLARPDADISMPYDARTAPAEAARDEHYGEIEITVAKTMTTHSTSRKELTTLIFEAANAPMPPWDNVLYEGRPAVIEGARRTAFGAFAYVVFPGALAIVALLVRPRRRS